MRKICVTVIFFLFVFQISSQPPTERNRFRFVFMTDIHVQPEQNATKGFLQAIDTVNSLNPDFILTGGDLIMDALGVPYSRADSLFTLYSACCRKFHAPVYNTMGNHEIFALYRKAGADTINPLAGTRMYEKRIGKTYYTFTFGGWKFFVLKSVLCMPDRKYSGGIDLDQMAWIKEELAHTDPEIPICISVHIPMMTVYSQVVDGATKSNEPGMIITNAKEVLALFKGYNLKLVLQGHLHYLEEIYVQDIRYITGGSIASGWWKKITMNTPFGFLVLDVDGEKVTWQYKTYGWRVN